MQKYANKKKQSQIWTYGMLACQSADKWCLLICVLNNWLPQFQLKEEKILKILDRVTISQPKSNSKKQFKEKPQ